MLSALMTFDHGRNLWRITDEIGEEVGTAVMVDPPTASTAAVFCFTRSDGAVFVGHGTLTEAAGQVAEALGYDLRLYAGGLDDGSPELCSAEPRATERDDQHKSLLRAVLNKQVLSAWADLAPAATAITMRTVDQDARVDGAEPVTAREHLADEPACPEVHARTGRLTLVENADGLGNADSALQAVDGFDCSECGGDIFARLSEEGLFFCGQEAVCLSCGAVHTLDVDEGWDADDDPRDVGTASPAWGYVSRELLDELNAEVAS